MYHLGTQFKYTSVTASDKAKPEHADGRHGRVSCRMVRGGRATLSGGRETYGENTTASTMAISCPAVEISAFRAAVTRAAVASEVPHRRPKVRLIVPISG